MKIETINIKEGFPPADVAIANFQIEIERFQLTDTKIVKVIHGYGSHGVGGEIKKQLHIELKKMKNRGLIKDFIPGERFGAQERLRINEEKDFPELILDSDLKGYNSGITLVFLNDKK